jgi:hypothetical protein
MRIYILNPDLLLQARPERFQFIAQYFPELHEAGWWEVLGKAPAFIHDYARRFAEEGMQAAIL